MAHELVAKQVLEAVSGNAIEAALQAAEQERKRQGEHRRTLAMGAEHAHYQARLAERRYEAVDPDQRLVAGELEARWNAALAAVRESEIQCEEFDQRLTTQAMPSKELLMSLAQDLSSVWNTSDDARLKQRIVHLVLREIVADVDAATREVTLVLHWAGGRHSEARWTKHSLGWNGRINITALEVITKMASDFPDKEIAHTLNRQRLRTTAHRGWNVQSVARLRKLHQIPEFRGGETETTLTLQQTAQQLQVSIPTVLRLIRADILPARQAVGCAPWQIRAEAIESEAVKRALAIGTRRRRARIFSANEQQQMFSDT
jgi:hypothetical protein